MIKKKRSVRRHHRERLFNKMRRRVKDWYKYSVMRGSMTEEEAQTARDRKAIKQTTTRQLCDNPPMRCGNQRKLGDVTMQEKRAELDMEEQIEQMFYGEEALLELFDEEMELEDSENYEEYVDELENIEVVDDDWYWAWNLIERYKQEKDDD